MPRVRGRFAKNDEFEEHHRNNYNTHEGDSDEDVKSMHAYGGEGKREARFHQIYMATHYCSDNLSVVSIKEDTAYLCLDFTRNQEELKSNTPYPEDSIRCIEDYLKIPEDIESGPYSKKPSIRRIDLNQYVVYEEIDEQELEAHYSYMAKIQEVPNADSGTDAEPLEQVQYDTDDNVFANDIQHFEQSESIRNTCVVEMGDSNVLPDSPDMCDNDIQDDQNDVEYDDERVALANLIANLKLDVDENKKIQKQLKKANATLTQELTECKSILAETSRTLGESNSIRDSCLVALQNKQTEFERTSNVNAVCSTCRKCVFNSNHDACVSKFLNDVNARTKKPTVVPISTRKPKSQANKSVATYRKKIVASESTITNYKSYYRMLYKKTSKAWKWWIAQQCPSAYTWVPKTKNKWVPKVRNDSVY
ncbi:hypothetical protein Tco_0676582 [Tanacetum coccineum]